jgi:hypothetical protein
MSKSPRSRTVAWNRGKIVGQKPPLKIKEVWAIRVRLQLAERSRDLAPFNLAIDSKLRGCDVVKVGVEDVVFSGTLRSRASVVQKKTGKLVTFEVTEQTGFAIHGWLHQLGWPAAGASIAKPGKPQEKHIDPPICSAGRQLGCIDRP